MGGFIICAATDCTEGLTLGEVVLGLLAAAAIVAGIVLLVSWLTRNTPER